MDIDGAGAEPSERLLSALLANIGDVVSVHDADGTILYVSPSAGRVIGEGAVAGLAGRDPFSFVVDADRERVRSVAGRWRNEGTGERVEFDVIGPSGEIRSVESSAVNLLEDPHVHGVVVTTRDVTERRRTEQELRRLALVDTLTGLPNRQLLLDRVERALLRQRAARGNVAVLLVDLDDFKAVNDAAGHVAGDELLVEAARRLAGLVPTSDTVGRWGGDEFVVVVESSADLDGLAELSDRILETMAEPFRLAGTGEVYVGASVGIALGPTADAHEMLAAADAAMHWAKERGRSRAEVFDESLRESVVERLRIHSELPRALERGEFELHYQPIIDLTTRAAVGVEALIRWRHPTRGLLAPGTFLPVAERSGLIRNIGTWVLRTACAEAVSWARRGIEMQVAVNLSARQLADPAVAGEIEEILSATGLPPSQLTLEVTESAVMADPSTAQVILARLRGRGARVAVDDFGTGYSSLGYLRHLPCDVVKIDRSFVAGIGSAEEDTVIVEAVVALAHTLGLYVTAEGCEHEAQAAKLAELGADRAQGYLWARPVPAGALPDLLSRLGGPEPRR